MNAVFEVSKCVQVILKDRVLLMLYYSMEYVE